MAAPANHFAFLLVAKGGEWTGTLTFGDFRAKCHWPTFVLAGVVEAAVGTLAGIVQARALA